ncbi:MAG: hypothetical protein JRG73_19435 [Deltaproteobacteria bacterium]|nr:hypothetical protein [Deltaproteobacteria bacterium]
MVGGRGISIFFGTGETVSAGFADEETELSDRPESPLGAGNNGAGVFLA